MCSRLFFSLVLILTACTAQPRRAVQGGALQDGGATADGGSVGADAGLVHDGGSDGGMPCPDGGTPDGFGNCRSCQNTCASDADCTHAACLRAGDGCLYCEPPASRDGGSSCQSGPCRSSGDCCSGASCISPGAITCGGACPPPPLDQCDAQHPCQAGENCVETPAPPCACMPGPVRVCQPPCTATSCGNEEICNTDGGCQARLCTDGYVCPSDATCSPANGDVHGCVLKSCSADPDCPTGYCIDGWCQSSLGHCQLPVP